MWPNAAHYSRGTPRPGAVFIHDSSGEQTTTLSPSVIADANYEPQGSAIAVTFPSQGIVLWSGTLSPSAPSADGAQVVFSGTVSEGGQESELTGLTIGSWSQS